MENQPPFSKCDRYATLSRRANRRAIPSRHTHHRSTSTCATRRPPRALELVDTHAAAHVYQLLGVPAIAHAVVGCCCTATRDEHLMLLVWKKNGGWKVLLPQFRIWRVRLADASHIRAVVAAGSGRQDLLLQRRERRICLGAAVIGRRRGTKACINAVATFSTAVAAAASAATTAALAAATTTGSRKVRG